jgi:hypothetical protein
MTWAPRQRIEGPLPCAESTEPEPDNHIVDSVGEPASSATGAFRTLPIGASLASRPFWLDAARIAVGSVASGRIWSLPRPPTNDCLRRAPARRRPSGRRISAAVWPGTWAGAPAGPRRLAGRSAAFRGGFGGRAWDAPPPRSRVRLKRLGSVGEPGGTRTHGPKIKSHPTSSKSRWLRAPDLNLRSWRDAQITASPIGWDITRENGCYRVLFPYYRRFCKKIMPTDRAHPRPVL